MVRILDKKATQPRRRFNLSRAVRIPHSPSKLNLASIQIKIPMNSQPNRVELVATVGVRGVTGIAQIRFKIWRNGRHIYTAQQGIESSGSERNYVVTFQAIDRNVAAGTHRYMVTAENVTRGTRAAVVGPVSFSGLAVRVRRANV
ncbi:exosporium protein C [Paenibacillus thermotolerans]|uniref:exosporium protein C n=1 Tax=Paenibacillus thermotolerans TaxID=3027807 RepID=UPI002368988B|nr:MULTISPECIES: exosporium protein C [unclassified Paenibacillus]